MARIKLSEIVIDPAVAIRQGTDEDTIQRYMDNFDELPPITVYQTDHKYLLADGFHRWAAATRLGHDDIEADVKQGTESEASEYAIYANLKHGKPLSREEYKNAVRRLKIIHPDWGSYKLAKAVYRSERFIESVVKVDEVRRINPASAGLDDTTVTEIARAPQEIWQDITKAAIEQEWTSDTTAQKVREIKAEPERVDEILAVEPPQPKESGEQLELSRLTLVFPKLNTYFANIATFRVQNRLTRDFLRPYAPHIYTWRDAVNELIHILEG